MARFKYSPGSSFFHKMDPTMKFVWVFTMIIAVIANFEIVYGAVWYLYVLILVFIAAKVSIKDYLQSVVFFFHCIALFLLQSLLCLNCTCHALWIPIKQKNKSCSRFQVLI